MPNINEVYQSRKCGPFMPISRDGSTYTCQFIETGTIVKAHRAWVDQGSVNDPYARTVHGVGYIGEGPYNSRVTREDGSKGKSPAYQMWANMLARVYVDPATGKRPTYQSVIVHPDWHNFQTFCHDIRQLDGYGAWAAYHAGTNPEVMELDKDILCAGLSTKEYGPNTCQFVTKRENLKAMWKARRETSVDQSRGLNLGS